jgi:hypothetical protein
MFLVYFTHISLKVILKLFLVHLHFDCNLSYKVQWRIFYLWSLVGSQNS